MTGLMYLEYKNPTKKGVKKRIENKRNCFLSICVLYFTHNKTIEIKRIITRSE
jgi:hypothetical protein